MNPEEIEKIIKLIVDLKLESNTLMWAAIAYFGLAFIKTVLGYLLLAVIGIYWAKVFKFLLMRKTEK